MRMECIICIHHRMHTRTTVHAHLQNLHRLTQKHLWQLDDKTERMELAYKMLAEEEERVQELSAQVNMRSAKDALNNKAREQTQKVIADKDQQIAALEQRLAREGANTADSLEKHLLLATVEKTSWSEWDRNGQSLSESAPKNAAYQRYLTLIPLRYLTLIPLRYLTLIPLRYLTLSWQVLALDASRSA